MKIGICTSHQSLTQALNAGADYIEVSNGKISAMDPEQWLQTLTEIQGQEEKIPVCNGLIPPHIRLTGADMDPDTVLAFARMSFPRLKTMGVRTLTLGSSGAKNVPEGFPFDQAMEQLTEAVRLLAGVAEELGQTIVLEPLCYQEANIINTVADSAALARRVGLPNVKAHVDYYHMIQNGETLEDLIPFIPLLGHVHIANPVTRGVVLPGDGIPYQALFDALRQNGYDGTVSYEGKKPDSPEQLTAMMSYLHSLANS